MMTILTTDIEQTIIAEIITPLLRNDYATALACIPQVLDQLHANIPANKRISYGHVYTIKVLSRHLYTALTTQHAAIFPLATALFTQSTEFRTTEVALGLLADYAVDVEYPPVLPYFEQAAASEEWDIREIAQMFFRRLIKRSPDEMHAYLLRLATADNPNIRRFISETLRPCQENQWFYKQPEYSLSILRHFFQEKAAYPRTSVGNNLSDLARRLPELVYGLVEELVASGDPNSYWIAYRACRNLVKKEPQRVMDLLKINEYIYKDRKYQRNDQGD